MPTFVVGTGRCGSTLISNMLNLHPKIVSISELFSMITDLGTQIPQAFTEEKIDGKTFWNILSGNYPIQNTMLRHGVAMSEVLYPCLANSRFSAQSGVPALLQTTLPHLTENHDELFDEVAAFLCSQPTAEIGSHYTTLFEWFRKRFHARVTVERSGGTLRLIHRLFNLFPEAKFVHIVRDGRDCAMSMQKHFGFRMVMLTFQLMEVLGINPYHCDDRRNVDDLPDDLVPFLPESFDPQAFREYDVSPSLYGHYWSGEIIEGLKVLANIPADQVLTIKYEDLLCAPRHEVERMLYFLDPELVQQSTIEQLSSLINQSSHHWQDLPERERNALNDACLPGFKALAEHNINYVL
ncbi:MAG: sulfotransferase [Chryseolinea sp.]